MVPCPRKTWLLPQKAERLGFALLLMTLLLHRGLHSCWPHSGPCEFGPGPVWSGAAQTVQPVRSWTATRPDGLVSRSLCNYFVPGDLYSIFLRPVELHTVFFRTNTTVHCIFRPTRPAKLYFRPSPSRPSGLMPKIWPKIRACRP